MSRRDESGLVSGFFYNITVGFCNDLMEDKSAKVMEGVNRNEI